MMSEFINITNLPGVSDQKTLTQSSSSGKLKRRVIIAFKICLTLIILYVTMISVDSKQLFSSFLRSNLWLIAVAAVMGFFNIYVQFYKWKLICSNTLGEKDNKLVWYSLLIGFAGAVITPFRLGEYAGRSYGLKNKDITKTTVSTLIDHFFSFIIIIIAGLLAGIVFLRWIHHISIETFLLLLVAEIFLLIIVNWFILKGSAFKFKIIEYFSNINILKRKIQRVEEFNGIDVNMRYKLLKLSILSFFFYIFQYSLLVCAFSGQWSLHLYFLAGILTIFTKTVIPAITFGDLGIREGASVFFVSQIGLPGIFGFNAAFMLFFMNVVIPSIIGGVLLSSRK